MVILAIIQNTILHAWRFRLPAVVAALMFLLLIALPQFTTGDGSPEGEIRLYLLYAGHLCTFGLSLAATLYAIWFENQEREHRVHHMIYTRPISYQLLLGSRVTAYLLMLGLMGCSFMATMAWTAQRHIAGLPLENSEKEELTQRLLEVRHSSPLTPIIEISKEDKRLERKFQEVISLEPGQRFPFALNPQKQHSEPTLTGRLLSISKVEQAYLRVSLVLEQRILWSQDLSIQPGQNFRCPLPTGIVQLSQQAQGLECHITQVNPNKEALYMPLDEPLSITHPAGNIYSNTLRAMGMVALLFLVLCTISVFIAQIMSAQGSCLVLFLIYIVGSFKASIRSLLFPSSPMIPGMPNSAASQDPFNLTDFFYSLIWKPILWLVPDFQALNPTSQLMNGDFIPWSTFIRQGTSTLPFLLIASFYLFYFLPRQEKASLRT